ncbi:hypothetical protein NEOLI_005407 [Neolecta irregularis DAH-3]|uniref:Uncharacterized protein n=1 Tax=Neolecta irregularis (strain DAH-3) TaxID=1198029 RepID=A0A1U7LHK2_NEOID|nr:hypothetical protein NEOLI_005407 [Neolecta irregularis DAH-3]|eukprot:OLL22124.1 hypothetical protein NEOLI_005407 [Neolecta irregularis DAH-3]
MILRPYLFLVSLFLIIHMVSADLSLSYCKCICSKNSTIIPLTDPIDPVKPCNQCTRKFCLDYNLPACTAMTDQEEITTICFQRESRKDKAIIIMFLGVTGGLMGIALIRKIAPNLTKEQRNRYSGLSN